jgi:heterodisulfide reductase subunit C
MIAESSHRHISPFLEEVIESAPGGERIVHCLQCGSCGGSCPSGADMEYTPRAVFAMIAANQRDRVLKANTMWCCVSCYFCTTRCPQNIPITEIMYALKRISIAEGIAKSGDGPALARTFTSMVEKFGRSFEFGLASTYYFFNKPGAMLKMGPMGLSMFSRGRLSLIPKKIRQVGQLQAIIKKAKEIGGVS